MNIAHEAIKQFAEGYDFEPLARLIGDLTPDQSMQRREGWPYTLAGLAAHVLFWQKLWLDGIHGRPIERGEGRLADWPSVTAEDWPGIRESLLKGLEEALMAASDESHLERIAAVEVGETVAQTLLRIALHNAYHAGQIALMRQELGLWPPAGGKDAW